MWQAKVVVCLIEGALVPYARLAFTQRDEAPADSSHMLPNREVDALNERRVDLPARGGEHPVDSGQGAEHQAVAHAHQPTSAIRLDDLRIE
jgi:hypothetical protein